MALSLKGKVAIVTGAGRGLGREEALLLARYGAKVLVNDVGGAHDGKGQFKGPADDVVKEIRGMGGEAAPNYESVTSFASAKKIIDQAVSAFGKLDILVNNAGILRDKMLFNMEEEEWDSVIGVHLKGTFNCTRHACSYWRNEQKAGRPVAGRLINTASDAGLLYNAGQSNYGAAKAGIIALTLIAAKEMEKYGVTANVIVPLARTRLTTEATPSMAPMMGTEESFKKMYGYDLLAPEMTAPLVVYLASDDARGISGQVVRVVGGYLWLLQSWRSGEAQKRRPPGKWNPEEIGPVLKQLLAKAPKREDPVGTLSSILK